MEATGLRSARIEYDRTGAAPCCGPGKSGRAAAELSSLRNVNVAPRLLASAAGSGESSREGVSTANARWASAGAGASAGSVERVGSGWPGGIDWWSDWPAERKDDAKGPSKETLLEGRRTSGA